MALKDDRFLRASDLTGYVLKLVLAGAGYFFDGVTGRSGPHPEAPSSTDWSYSPGAVPGQRRFH